MGIRIESREKAQEIVAKINGVCHGSPFFALAIEPKNTFTISCSPDGVVTDNLCVLFEHGSCRRGIDRTQLLEEIVPQLDRM